MNWKNLLCLTILAISFQWAAAQERGEVIVTKDPLIDSLIARRLALSKKLNSGTNISSSGFRLQIFSAK